VKVDYTDSPSVIEIFEKNRRDYFKYIAKEISYELAKKVYGKEDKEIKEISGVLIPFYFEELLYTEDFAKREGDTIYLYSRQKEDIIKEDGVYRRALYTTIYTCKIEDGKIESYSKTNNYLKAEKNLKLFNVSYEHYSSFLVDTGGNETILAKNADEARSICSQAIYPPEEGLSWSFKVYDEEKEEYYSDNSPYSYVEAIENPGIARAEREMNL